MKNAVVTGGGSASVRPIANRLRADGYHVATLDLNPSDDEFAFTADVTDRAAGRRGAGRRSARSSARSSILVNAAGLDSFKRFTDVTFERWQRVIDVNLNGVFHCVQAVLPDMIEAGWGRIVNISSSSTHSGAPYMSPYVAAKSAVNGLTKIAGTGVRPERHHRQRGAAGLHRHPDAAQGRRQGLPRRHRQDHRPRPRCGASAGPRTSPPRAPSSSPRRPATSPARSSGVNGGRNT